VYNALTDAPIWVKSKAGNQQFANGLDKQVFGKEKVSGKTRLRAAIYRRRSPCRFSHVRTDSEPRLASDFSI